MKAIHLNPRVYLLLFAILFGKYILLAQVGIGTATPNTSSILDIKSTTKGVLLPCMKELERNRINSPAEGLIIQEQFTGKLAVYQNNTAQWGAISPVVNTNVNFAAFFTANQVNVFGKNIDDQFEWFSFSYAGTFQSYVSSNNIIVFYTTSHAYAVYVPSNAVGVQISSVALAGGAVTDLGITETGAAVLIKGLNAYDFRTFNNSWGSTAVTSTPTNFRVLKNFIIFTAGGNAYYGFGFGLNSSAIIGSHPIIYANSIVAIIYTPSNLYSYMSENQSGSTNIQAISNTLTSAVTNVYDMGQKNRIIVQANNSLRVFQYVPDFGGSWPVHQSLNISGPVNKVVAVAQF